jgi:adenylylsulfate kinase
MADQLSPHIRWHRGSVARPDREALLGQRGVAVWLTGLSGSGKSTIAFAAEKALVEAGHLAVCLDGDNLRHGLCADLSFTPEDRAENVRRAGEVAKLFVDSGAIVLASLISPTRAGREAVRSLLGPSDFLEVYVQASLETCEGRDVKGLYGQARAGEIADFTGLAYPYEPPEAPDLVLDTESLEVDQAVAMLVGLLLTAGKIGRQAAR